MTERMVDSGDADIRFLLANERTLLAWMRTAITLQAGGLAVAQFANSEVVGQVFGAIAVLLGAWAGIIGYRRFQAAGRAIREGRLPPVGRSPGLLIAATVALALALLVVVVVGAW
jgi:putative membrane protein